MFDARQKFSLFLFYFSFVSLPFLLFARIVWITYNEIETKHWASGGEFYAFDFELIQFYVATCFFCAIYNFFPHSFIRLRCMECEWERKEIQFIAKDPRLIVFFNSTFVFISSVLLLLLFLVLLFQFTSHEMCVGAKWKKYVRIISLYFIFFCCSVAMTEYMWSSIEQRQTKNPHRIVRRIQLKAESLSIRFS